jgi:hypothetical protein
MEQLVTRAYNRFEIDEMKSVIRKLSSTERLRDEIYYYINLQLNHPEQSVLFPRLLNRVEPLMDEFWMDLELYGYPNVGSYLFDSNTMPSWSEFFIKLRDILISWTAVNPHVKWTDVEIRDAAHDMYITKTEREYKNFYDGWKNKLTPLFSGQSESRVLRINGNEYFMFEIIWPQIKQYIEENMLSFTPSIIHGDCCFSNILYGETRNIIRFIDPRGSFGKIGNYGDIRYDVAKLYHSLDGTYEAFITDKFHISFNNNQYQLNIEVGEEFNSVLAEFESIFFQRFSKKEIKIIQGCIFIGMCARHYDNLERQTAMYLTGVRLLNESLKL